jgi:gluconate 2-dehydrogenase subunit 3-like protein
MTDIGRRAALKLIGAAPLALGFGVGRAEAAAAGAHAATAVQSAAKGAVYKPKFFTASEWQTVRLLVDMIIPKDERSGSATDAGVPEFMDYLMNDPTDSDRSREWRQTAMRGGLAWVNSVCTKRFGHDFPSGTDAERILLLDDIAYFKGHDDEEEEAEMREPRDLRVHIHHGPSFFNSFRDLTASGFWSSKMGIEDLEYKGNTYVAEWTGGAPPEVLRQLGLSED